jgi:hypothetical protein
MTMTTHLIQCHSPIYFPKNAGKRTTSITISPSSIPKINVVDDSSGTTNSTNRSSNSRPSISHPKFTTIIDSDQSSLNNLDFERDDEMKMRPKAKWNHLKGAGAYNQRNSSSNDFLDLNRYDSDEEIYEQEKVTVL